MEQTPPPAWMKAIPLKRANFNIFGEKKKRIPISNATHEQLLDALLKYVERHGYFPSGYGMFYHERRLPTLEDIEDNVVKDRRRVAFALAQRQNNVALVAGQASLARDGNDVESRGDEENRGNSSMQEASGPSEPAAPASQNSKVEDMESDVMENVIEEALRASRLATRPPPPHVVEQAMKAARAYFRQPSPELTVGPPATRPFVPYVSRLRPQHDALYEAYHRGPNDHPQLPNKEWAQFIHALPEAAALVLLSSPDHLEGISEGDLTVDIFINSMRDILDNAMGGQIPELGYAVPDESWMDGYLPELPALEPWYFADMLRAMIEGETTEEWEKHLERLGLYIDYRGSCIKPRGFLRLRILVGRFLETRREKARQVLVKRMMRLVQDKRIQQSAVSGEGVQGAPHMHQELPVEMQRLGISNDTSRAAILRLLKPRGYDPEISGNIRQWCDSGMLPSQQIRLQFPEYNPRVHGTFPQWHYAGRPAVRDLRGPFTFRPTRYTPSVHGTYRDWMLMGRPAARLLQVAARDLVAIRGWENTLGEYEPAVHGTICEWFDGFLAPDLKWDNRGTNPPRLPVPVLAGERIVIMKRERSDEGMSDMPQPKRSRQDIIEGLKRW